MLAMDASMGSLSVRLESQNGRRTRAPDAVPTHPARSQQRWPLRVALPVLILAAAAMWAAIIALVVHFVGR